MDSFKECEHLLENDICLYCGLIIENKVDEVLEFTKNCPKISLGKPSIIDSLNGIPFDVISRTKSNISIKQEQSGKKVRNDNKNTFVEIYNAYLECGYNNFNPENLASQLKLSRKDVNWCLKLTSGTSLVTKFTDDDSNFASIVILSPLSYLDSLCERNNIEDHIEKIKEITKTILEKKDILYSSRPKYIACAIVKKYCEELKKPIKCFSKNNFISDNALKKSYNDIKEFFYLFKQE